ncbi:MAG: class I SAM-dependent methyltransferase [Rhodobacteraceae bacterium]|nr:class I SAM-dependent methyltransferase [Paracoccaceae bacterium]
MNDRAPVSAQNDVNRATIADFGEQWTTYRDNSGYYGSVALLADIFGPLLNVDSLVGARVGDIGSGSGRIVAMLLAAGARHVVAVEPSAAFEVLKENLAGRSADVTFVHASGEEIPREPPLDLIVSIGVLHHVVDPTAIVTAAREALRPGGRLLVWLYGYEGNERYLAVVRPLRSITKRLPHWALAGLCYIADGLILAWAGLAKRSGGRLKLSDYLENVYLALEPDKRRLVIYDQLNPAYAHYYTRQQALDLLESAGFVSVSAHHRHGYSWTVMGERPVD